MITDRGMFQVNKLYLFCMIITVASALDFFRERKSDFKVTHALPFIIVTENWTSNTFGNYMLLPHLTLSIRTCVRFNSWLLPMFALLNRTEKMWNVAQSHSLIIVVRHHLWTWNLCTLIYSTNKRHTHPTDRHKTSMM